MNNPQAVKFISKQIRPLAEMARDFIIRATPALQEWATLEQLFADGAELIEDDRGNEGVSPLTCAQVKAFIAILLALNFSETEMAISALCVREPLNLE